MRFYSILTFLLLCSLASSRGINRIENRAGSCPDSALISPCVCTVFGSQADISCIGLTSLKSLTDIFARTFPSNTFTSIVISGSQLGPLPNDVFNGKSFEIIAFLNNGLTSFDNTRIFSSSQTLLKSLTVRQDTDDWTFNFANLQDYNSLLDLELSGYNMVLSGTLSSSSLVALTLRSDLLVAEPNLGALPSLSVLNLDGSSIASVDGNTFGTISGLSELYLGHNKLESMLSGALSLTGPVTAVDLSSNLIDTFQPGWLTGISSATTVQLINNYITVLDRPSFEGVIQALAPTGKLRLDGNPLTCGCEIAWIVTDATYLSVANDGRCVNGTRLTSLNPDYYSQNC